MSILSVFYQIVIAPIEMIIEWIFLFYEKKIKFGGTAGAIVAVSLGVNFLALPLYNIADRLQEKERNLQQSLSKWVKHIKTHFKGDERFMMLQAYYRENNYHPLYALRSSLSILIEIPFFIAAYHFLSNSTSLHGTGFAFIKDFGIPDKLINLSFGTKLISINILPVIMTLINFVSGAIYLKKAPIKEKIQLYGLALVFLFLLYNSPSGLVCYWILNNLFSLFKNIIAQRKNPNKIYYIIISTILSVITVLLCIKKGSLHKKMIIVLFVFLFISFPYIIKFLKNKIHLKKNILNQNNIPNVFPLFFCGLGTALLTGYLLPSIIISSSPIEFANLGSITSPLTYIFSSVFFFIGLFVFWPCVIYYMFNQKVKNTITAISFLTLIFGLLNTFVFKYDYGIIDVIFNVENDLLLMKYGLFYTLIPVLVFALIITAWFFIKKYNLSKLVITLSIVLCLAEFSFATINVSKIKTKYIEFKNNSISQSSKNSEIEKVIHLSKTKQNVIVLFLDRAIGCYFPYFLEQFPEYKKSFDGFINYKNTLSYGAYTLTGIPPILGGYEYTPEKMSERDSELLVDKHNEATILLPTLFSEKNWKSTVINPPWSNYKEDVEKDYSEFEGVKNTTVHNLIGEYTKTDFFSYSTNFFGDTYDIGKICKHEIVNFNIMQILPPFLRNTFYGDFRRAYTNIKAFIDNYSAMYYINEETDFDSDDNNYVFYANNTIHMPTYLNETFDFPTLEKNENTGSYKTYNDFETQLYEVYCAIFIKTAKFLDYLRENDAYDNSRIIIVSDHGYHVNMQYYSHITTDDIKDSLYDFRKSDRQIPNSFDCTLMFKEFNCNEPLKTDDTFMTNADSFYFAIKDLNLSDTNPFTGKKFSVEKDNGMNLFFQLNEEIDADVIRDKTHITIDEKTAWHFVPGDIDNPKNWIPYKIWKKQRDGE